MIKQKHTDWWQLTSNSGFKIMAFFFKIRDCIRPRQDIVKEIGLKEGFRVLDYGCGPAATFFQWLSLLASRERSMHWT
jgi:ubiquinone/menaquinone biosynthesis C-methylase UbiE